MCRWRIELAVAFYVAFPGTPLCPAGLPGSSHGSRPVLRTPHKEGDWLGAPVSPNKQRCKLRDVSDVRRSGRLSISPLVGEMSGRTEGGARGTTITIPHP
ncbi:hypothetical protein GCM10010520_67550 [Rhizobium viscosum]